MTTFKQSTANAELRATAIEALSDAQQAFAFGRSVEEYRELTFAGSLIDEVRQSDALEGRRYEALEPVNGNMKIVDLDAPAPTFKPSGGKLVEAGNLTYKQAVVYKRTDLMLIRRLQVGEFLSDAELRQVIRSANNIVRDMTIRMQRSFSEYIVSGLITGTASAEAHDGTTVTVPVPVTLDIALDSLPDRLWANTATSEPLKDVARAVATFAGRDIVLQELVMNQNTYNNMTQSESLKNLQGTVLLEVVDNEIGQLANIGGYRIRVVNERKTDGTPLIPNNKVLFIGDHNVDPGARIVQVDVLLDPGVYGQRLFTTVIDAELGTQKTIHEVAMGFDILSADAFISMNV